MALLKATVVVVVDLVAVVFEVVVVVNVVVVALLVVTGHKIIKPFPLRLILYYFCVKSEEAPFASS